MEVRLRPAVPGCVTVPLAILSLGLIPLMTRRAERHFIARMDDQGFETRGGRRIAWSEVERVQRTIGKVRGVELSDELLVYTSKGRFSLPTWRIDNAEEALAYLVSHEPRAG